MWMNDDAKAVEYYRLDAGSEYQKRWDALLRLRRGDAEPIQRLTASATFGDWATILSGSGAARDRAVAEAEQISMRDRDPEGRYTYAGILARAGFPANALRLLRSAVEGNYLAVAAMDQDPLFDSIRKTPEFAAIRAEAVRRQQEFLAKRGAPPA
jgi:hypothetical protein